jgi:hypothetical protein
MTLHDLSTALRFADKCLFLKDGSIHAVVSPQKVSSEIINQVYGITADIHYYNGYPIVIPNLKEPEISGKNVLHSVFRVLETVTAVYFITRLMGLPALDFSHTGFTL